MINREIDALVATELGCTVGWYDHRITGGIEKIPTCACPSQWGLYPHSDNDDPQIVGALSDYSSDISAAWPVWLRMPMKIGDRGCFWAMSGPRFDGQVSIWRQLVGQPTYEFVAKGPTPLAICLAFLAAMGVEVPMSPSASPPQSQERAS